MESLAERDRRYVWHPFTQMQEWTAPLVISAAEGNYLIDSDGRRYLDGVSSLWCNVHGHRHPALDAALRAQLDRVAHSTLLGLASAPSIEFAERLVGVVPRGLTKVFYSDSGSTAVEAALKMAYQCQAQRGHSQRRRFLALHDAYHGDTLGSVSVGRSDLFHEVFRPLLFDVLQVATSIDELERVFAEHGHELAAFVMEPLIQGAAGMLLQPPGFLRAARRLCDQHGVLLICDEVATGFGRTGTLFACEQEGVTPDFLCLAKGITGGYLPLAATLTTEAVYEAFLGPYGAKRTFFHGHTYTGNALACAVAIASLELFEREHIMARVGQRVQQLQALLAQEIAPLAHVKEIRQKGLMVGIELIKDRDAGVPYDFAEAIGARVCAAARQHGVIIRPLGPVVVLMPPLSISESELALLVSATKESIVAIT